MSAVYREWEGHLAGEIAIALRVGNGKGRSRLLAIDVDARAPQRIPAIVDELRRRGYGDATLVTDGSAPDRGKVLVFFCREQQGGALRQLASDVLRVARDGAAWGIEAPGDIAIFPFSPSASGLRLSIVVRRRSEYGRRTEYGSAQWRDPG